MSTKHDLLEGLLSRDPKRIQAIYQTIFPKVQRFVLNNEGDGEDAKDIFQKVLLQLITRIKVDHYQLIDSFEAYLFTACKNLWRRELNRKSRVTKSEKDEYSVGTDEHDMALAILEQERWELYQRCFNKLSENCQKILGMYFKKISYSQIRSRLSYASETVVRQRVFKCKAKLSELVRTDHTFHKLKNL